MRQYPSLWGLAVAVLALYALALADLLSGDDGREEPGVSLAADPVPRQFAARLPAPMPADAPTRKQLFLATVLPLVLRVNEDIRAARARLIRVRGLVLNGRPLPPSERTWLRRLAERYGTETTDFAVLLRRVDVIPPSLALAQAATESGWGESRFAQQGNALFGQRVWRAGAGLIPAGRADGGQYEVRRFADLEASIRAYARNLNSHPAYDDFRVQRASRRPKADPIALAATLSAYSELGAEYADLLGQVIRENQLRQLDTARLAQP